MTTDEKALRRLLKDGLPSNATFTEALARTGRLIDLSHDLQDEDAANVALGWTSELRDRESSDPERAELEYFTGNAWAAIHSIRHAGKDSGWEWELPEFEKQVLHHRTALRIAEGASVGAYRRCQMHTNLGNILSSVGRFVDSIDEWDAALSIEPNFAMALGNRGQGLYHYGFQLHDSGHQSVFAARAASLLTRALSGTLEHGSREPIERLLEKAEWVCTENGVDRNFDLDSFSLGDSPEEIAYRSWCLENRLFLNPLNDIGPHAVAATDVLMLPSLTLPFDKPPSLLGFYNQLKQEFASARFFLYESINSFEPHFSDKDVKLVSTFDYPAYGLAVEKQKAAFRTFYSVLDKIAFFLNEYFELGIPGHRTQLRTVWYEKQTRKKGIRPEFASRKNWPLRGLYWLTKDLSEDRDEFVEAMHPDAREVAAIRNHLEHKYLKLHDGLSSPESRALDEKMGITMDNLAHSVDRNDFELKTMRLMKLARAALIYLSLAVHVEEELKAESSKAFAAPMLTDILDDEWKV